jgi:leucyl-tRNA synthetase
MKMSKSKRNVVEPSELISKYGADTARVFILFAAPPERDLDWSEQGVEGAFRFLGRIYRLVAQRAGAVAAAAPIARGDSEEVRRIRQVTHRTLAKVTEDIEERFHFNTAISAIMEMVNQLYLVEDAAWSAPGTAAALREAVEILLHMLQPFAPHLAEELWAGIGGKDLLCVRPWPEADAAIAREEQVEVAVQVNGKVRAKVTVGAGASQDEVGALAMAEPRVMEHIAGKTVRKTIYVPSKLFSIVAN